MDISSAYGRTSPDGTHSPQTPPVGYSEHYFSDAESEREDSYYKVKRCLIDHFIDIFIDTFINTFINNLLIILYIDNFVDHFIGYLVDNLIDNCINNCIDNFIDNLLITSLDI